MQDLVYNTFPKKDGSDDLTLVDDNYDKICSVCYMAKPDMMLRSCEHWIHFKCSNSSDYCSHICDLCGPQTKITIKPKTKDIFQYYIRKCETKNFEGGRYMSVDSDPLDSRIDLEIKTKKYNPESIDLAGIGTKKNIRRKMKST